MQRRVADGKVFLSLANNTLAGVFGCLILVNTAWAQYFDNFRYVGTGGIGAGTVTHVDLGDNGGELAFFDAAGLSTVFSLSLRQSEVISSNTPVHAASNVPANLIFSDLSDIAFFTGELKHDTSTAPPHWFRLTRYQGQWSGVFRVGKHIYSLDRSSNVLDVRSTPSSTVQLRPELRVKISAVLDAGYLNDDTTANTLKHVSALESIHVMESLLSDSLGLTVAVEQLVLTAIDWSSPEPATNAAAWLQDNNQNYGLADNLATLFFVGDSTAANAAQADDNLLILGSSPDDQFATAHHFGKFLQLRNETDTLQDWRSGGLVALPAVHWSNQQRDDFNNNTPAANLVQILSYDQPIATPEIVVAPPIDSALVDSDSSEPAPPTSPEVISPQNDAIQSNNASSGGGGTLALLMLGALAIVRFKHKHGHKHGHKQNAQTPA